MYKCDHFAIHEFVPPHIFKLRGEKAWQLMDENILRTADRLRRRYGKMKINDYYWGGEREWSGLRTSDSPYYSKTSQHTFGRAIDVIFTLVTAEEVRQDILTNPELYDYRLIMSMELGTSWLHIDTRNCERIFTYYPRK